MKAGTTRFDRALKHCPHWLLIPMAALIATSPLIVHGCSCGHDFDFHLLNWMEAATQFSHGNLHPHWAYTPAFNAGEPRFVFYPPISWYLGAVLGLILTHLPGVSEAAAWTAAPIFFTWIALTLSGFAMHRLARQFATPNAALLAATIYLANPYMLFTAYERTAYAELLAAAWMPLLVLGILRARVTVAGIAVPLALLWLTNAPAAVMGSYALALLAMIRIVSTYRGSRGTVRSSWAGDGGTTGRTAALRLAVTTATGTILGLGLATFYILPAAYERRYVQIAMAMIAGMRIDENFLFERTGVSFDAVLHDTVLHTASVIAVVVLTATGVALYFSRKRVGAAAELKMADFPIVPLAIVAAAIGFLLTPWSGMIWRYAPQAAFLQFPWRLLAVLAVILALAASRALSSLRLKATLASGSVLGLAAILSFPEYHAFRQRCFREDTPAARLALFHSNAGTDPTDEYTPVGADNDAHDANDPPYWLADAPDASAPVGPARGAAPSEIAVAADHAEELILNLRNYPAWRITVNGTPAPDALHRTHRADGLTVLPVPAGPSVIDIRYALLPDQKLGDVISVIALALIGFNVCRRVLAEDGGSKI